MLASLILSATLASEVVFGVVKGTSEGTLKDFVVPLLVAFIGASGAWLTFKQGQKTAHSQIQKDVGQNAISGFSSLTKQLRDALVTQDGRNQQLQSQLDECFKDRAHLRLELEELSVRLYRVEAKMDKDDEPKAT
jgi:hypothetical protein